VIFAPARLDRADYFTRSGTRQIELVKGIIIRLDRLLVQLCGQSRSIPIACRLRQPIGQEAGQSPEHEHQEGNQNCKHGGHREEGVRTLSGRAERAVYLVYLTFLFNISYLPGDVNSDPQTVPPQFGGKRWRSLRLPDPGLWNRSRAEFR
jgi:hypothetical protein